MPPFPFPLQAFTRCGCVITQIRAPIRGKTGMQGNGNDSRHVQFSYPPAKVCPTSQITARESFMTTSPASWLGLTYCTNRKDYTDVLPHHTTIRQYRYADDRGISKKNKVEILERKSYVARTLGAQLSNGKYDRCLDFSPNVFSSILCCKTCSLSSAISYRCLDQTASLACNMTATSLYLA